MENKPRIKNTTTGKSKKQDADILKRSSKSVQDSWTALEAGRSAMHECDDAIYKIELVLQRHAKDDEQLKKAKEAFSNIHKNLKDAYLLLKKRVADGGK